MAWSIFDLPNGDQVATAWAVNLLLAIGAPTSLGNITFVYQWEKSEGGGGMYNPLNQGPVPGDSNLTTTGSQYGGGAADYASWEDGLAGAVAYLDMPNFASVKQALVNNDYMAARQALWASPWAASHYGNGANWSSEAAPLSAPQELQTIAQTAGMPPNMAQAADQAVSGMPQGDTGGGTVGTPQSPSGSQPAPQGLSMNDIPAVQSYIRQNYGSDAWLLDIPEVSSALEKAVVSGESTQQIQAAIEQTDWWKTTSQAAKNYQQNRANDPADYSFTTPGSTAAQTLAAVTSAAGQNGVQLDPATAQQIAQNALQYGWTTQQIQQAIGSRVQYNGQRQNNAAGIVAQLKAAAGQYYMTPSTQALQSWAQNIAAGTQTVQQFQALMQNNAALKWTGYAPQLQQGNTMVQLTDTLRNEAAKTMEVDPSTIDFVNNPTYSKILDYVPPDSPNGVHRVMTNSEMDQYLKSQPAWGYTQQARDQAAQLEQTISQTWGKVAS